MKKWIAMTGRALTIAIALSSSLIITMAHDPWPVKSDRTAGTSTPGAPAVEIRLPERFRLLTDQQFDLRVEATGLSRADARLQIVLDGKDITSSLPVPEVTIEGMTDAQLTDKAWTYRKISLPNAGVKTLDAVVSDGTRRVTAQARIGVQDFQLQGQKSIILFLGDAMGTAYRDAGRIVAKSTHGRFRQGFFDEWQEMDSMPVTGMVMTYALDRIVPDSANTATAWCTGNKTVDGALGVFPDNNDYRFDPMRVQETKQYALDNPRVETLWEYLKRRFGYKAGIVTTADVTDATPAGEGAHTVTRSLLYDIAKQYVDGVFTSEPTFDVIMGGGKERFTARTRENSGDTRDLARELQAAGYTYVQTRTELNALPDGARAPSKLLGLFRTDNMNVTYDKLHFIRPIYEPEPNFAGFTDQPFLDEMTAKALATLSKDGSPFILMVEGASIDKQSHPNDAAGVIWDTIEFDKAVGVGRAFAKTDTLVLVTADHDQSMSVIGLTDTAVEGSIQNTRSNMLYPIRIMPPPASNQGYNPGDTAGFPDYTDANGDGYPENTNRFRIAVGFRSGNHTGSSVPITAEGPGALLFTGYFDQTDIFFKMAKVLSGDTQALDQALQAKLKAEREMVGPNY